MYGMGSSFESGGKRWRVSVFGYPRECVDDFLLQAQWRPCELLAQQRHRQTMKGFIRRVLHSPYPPTAVVAAETLSDLACDECVTVCV
jgi:hypothetical protein